MTREGYSHEITQIKWLDDKYWFHLHGNWFGVEDFFQKVPFNKRCVPREICVFYDILR